MSAINELMPVGTLIHSCLTETQFQDSIGSVDWVLCDGRSVAGSHYDTITGNSTIPDARGRFLRARDGGAGVDPDAPALLVAQSDRTEAHHHKVYNESGTDHDYYNSAANTANMNQKTTGAGDNHLVVGVAGEGPSADMFTSLSGVGSTFSPTDDTRPSSLVINVFVKIN